MEHKELTAQLRRMSVETIEKQAAAIEDLREHECSGLIEE